VDKTFEVDWKLRLLPAGSKPSKDICLFFLCFFQEKVFYVEFMPVPHPKILTSPSHTRKHTHKHTRITDTQAH
jgi:hypothetical protein